MVHGGVSGVPRVVLASGSPRRAAILRTLGIEPEIRPADVDESVRSGEDAAALVQRLAVDKLSACVQSLPPSDRPALIVAADTVVDIDGTIMGKPEGTVEATRMLSALSGREHQVVTGIAAALSEGDTDEHGEVVAPEVALVETTVRFRSLSADLIDWYVATGEPLDKAGAYGIQGRGALLVEGISGSYPNVVGLPVVALDHVCTRLGRPLHHLAGDAAEVGAAIAAGVTT